MFPAMVVAEKKCLLRNEADMPPQILRDELPKIAPSSSTDPAVGSIMRGIRFTSVLLPAAGVPDDSDSRGRPELQVDSVERAVPA